VMCRDGLSDGDIACISTLLVSRDFLDQQLVRRRLGVLYIRTDIP